MKKISLLLTLFLCISSVFAAKTYLVQSGASGAATWRAASAGEILVNLSTVKNGGAASYSEWYKDKFLTTPTFAGDSLASGDQIWFAAGTYTATSNITLKGGVKIYGGFAGTETTINNRAKGSKPWEYTNVTIFDGNNDLAVNQCITTLGLSKDALVDGITIQNFKGIVGQGGIAALLTGGTTMQNCVITGNTSTGTGTQSAGGVRLTGGKLLHSYIHHNTTTVGGGGGIGIQNASKLIGCLIENNASATAGGGVMYSNNAGFRIDSCIIRNNTATTNGGGFGSFYSTASAIGDTIANTQITGNIASGSATGGGGGLTIDVKTSPFLLYNCVVENNSTLVATSTQYGGGGVYLRNGLITIDKCLIKGNTSQNSNGGGIFSYLKLLHYTVKNSILQGNVSAGAGSGIYSYQIDSCYISNTVFANNTGSSVNYHAVTNAGFYNNCTFASNLKVDATPAGVYFSAPTITSYFTNCLFYNSGISPLNYSTGSVPEVAFCGFDVAIPAAYNGPGCITGITDASFVDALNHNYRLVSGSPAIDAGVDVSTSGITTDIEGTARPQGLGYDMGAYEYSTTGITPAMINVIGVRVRPNGVISNFDGSIRIFSITGKLIINNPVSTNQEVKLDKGVYVIRLKTSNKEITQKVVI
ncbi:MAG: T9SS type A sorting domain-containing protein [Bacteroidales bacterium]|nr:T9SS type A sorting domain-containing protein [Bacteroidales bacterium]